MTASGREVLEAAWAALGRDRAELAIVHGAHGPLPLDAVTDVGALAWGSVAAASLAAARLAGSGAVILDPERIAVAFQSERHIRVDGVKPDAFAPLSGFFRCADGWVRTHGNYPWHAAALREAMGLSRDADRDTTAEAFALRRARQAAEAVVAAGGVCSEVRREDPAEDAAARLRPLVQVERVGDAAPAPVPGASRARPLQGVRVLDLTRVIAGPVATRTLALLGADVLRIDPPRRAEIAWQHLDTGHGKRSAVLDARSARFDGLLAAADVIVTGYRPDALAGLGLSPVALAARRPGIVITQLSAWGLGDRRGFDSIVQAASGISWIESAAGTAPGALPAQALDHSAGYLLAATAMTLLARRAHEGGTWLGTTSLRRIAAELSGLPRHPQRAGEAADPATHLQDFDVAGTALRTAAPAVAYAGGPVAYEPPRPWGLDAASWRED